MNDTKIYLSRKWLRLNHVRYISRPTASILSAKEILDPSIHYPVLDHHLESSTCPTEAMICHEWYKELLYREDGCVQITFGTFQDPKGHPYPHKKYWTIGPLSSARPSPLIDDIKSYSTGTVAVSQSPQVHPKTHVVFLIHTRNIGPISPLYSTRPSHSFSQRKSSYAMTDTKS